MGNVRSIEEIIQSAIDEYLQDKTNIAPLIELFLSTENKNSRLQLHPNNYDNSRELFIKLLTGETIRKAGKPINNNNKENINLMLVYVAQYHGAGLPLISNGEIKQYKNYAIHRVCKEFESFNIKHNTLYNAWKDQKDSQKIKAYIDFGKNNKRLVLGTS